MKDSELTEIIKSFSKKELSEFGKFLSSAFFTHGRKLPVGKLVLLFNEIKRFYPDFSSKNFTKEKIFSSIYPGISYNDPTMRNLTSKLLGLVKQYFSVKHFMENSFEGNYNVCVEMFNRRLDKSFEKSVKEAGKNLETRRHDADHYYDKFRLGDYITSYKGRKSFPDQKEFMNMSGDFFRFVILRSLQIYMLLVNQHTIANHSIKKPFMEEMLSHLRENMNDYTDTPEISIYYSLLNLFISEDEKFYYDLKVLKEKYIKDLDVVEQNNLYLCMGNYCLKKIAAGDDKFSKERFEIDNGYLKSGLIDKKHYFKLPLYFSMAMNAIMLNEHKWLEDFRMKYLRRLSPDYRAFADNIIKAEVLYSGKQYDRALSHLAKITVELPYYKQLVRSLTLKIYYELKYVDEALALIDTSRHFIANDSEMVQEIKDELNKFLGFTRQLIAVRNDEDSAILKKAVEAAPGFRNKSWLLEKLSIKA